MSKASLSEGAQPDRVVDRMMTASHHMVAQPSQVARPYGNPAADRRYLSRARLWLLGMRVFLIAATLTLMASQTQALVGNSMIDAARWGLLTLLVAMIIVRPRGRVAIRSLRLVDGIFAAFIAFAAVSALYSIVPPLTIGRTISAVLLYGAVFWTVWFYADVVGATEVSDQILVAAAIMFVAGVFNAVIGSNAWYALRFRGVFGNPNSIGMLSIIFLPAAVGRFIRTKRIFPLLLIALILGSLILSGSRNGVMTSSLAIIFFLYRIRAWRASLVILAAAAVVLLTMPAPAEGTGDQDPLARLTTGQKIATGGGRVEAWEVAVPLIREEIVFGHGFGTEELIFRGRKFRVHRGEYVHNSYLGMSYQLGLVGAGLLFVPLFGLLATRVVSKRPVSIQEAVCEAVLLGGLIASMFESWIYSAGNAFAFPFWIFVMLLVRSRRAPPDPRDARIGSAQKPRNAISSPYLARPVPRPVATASEIRRFDPPASGGNG